jgi:methyl-accepting chemotaxis protein
VSAIEHISQMNAAIAGSAQQQTGTVDDIALSTEHIKHDAQHVTEQMSQINHAGDSLIEIGHALEEVVRKLKGH